VSLTPKPTYYRVAPAAGVNASASDMAQWLLAHTGHRPDVLPAPLLATLHALISTPGERRAGWRRERISEADYAIGWRVFDYAGHRVVFHAGAVQGYRGMIAMIPEEDFGTVILWNSESPLPSGLLPTILDRARPACPQRGWTSTRTSATTRCTWSAASLRSRAACRPSAADRRRDRKPRRIDVIDAATA
jgi:beta-lactamase class C